MLLLALLESVMYVPRPFQESSSEILNAFIAAHPLGTLVIQSAQGPDAYHLPFHLDETGSLHAHVARGNPIWRSVGGHENVLVIFHGPQAYISPDWYPSKHEDHRQVPTWNYQAVHARGRLVVHDDERYMRGLLARLTQEHEAGMKKPWQMSDAPDDYIDALLKAVVGIEIEVVDLKGIMKLGQNESVDDRTGAATQLIQRGEAAMGEAMLAANKP